MSAADELRALAESYREPARVRAEQRLKDIYPAFLADARQLTEARQGRACSVLLCQWLYSERSVTGKDIADGIEAVLAEKLVGEGFTFDGAEVSWLWLEEQQRWRRYRRVSGRRRTKC